MTRELKGLYTRDAEHPKDRFRSVFVALHGDAKRHPGGVTAMAQEMGVNPQVLADKLNPNIGEKVPTVRELLEVFERTRSVATGNALALLIDRTTVPVGDAHAAGVGCAGSWGAGAGGRPAGCRRAGRAGAAGG